MSIPLGIAVIMLVLYYNIIKDKKIYPHIYIKEFVAGIF